MKRVIVVRPQGPGSNYYLLWYVRHEGKPASSIVGVDQTISMHPSHHLTKQLCYMVGFTTITINI